MRKDAVAGLNKGRVIVIVSRNFARKNALLIIVQGKCLLHFPAELFFASRRRHRRRRRHRLREANHAVCET